MDGASRATAHTNSNLSGILGTFGVPISMVLVVWQLQAIFHTSCVAFTFCGLRRERPLTTQSFPHTSES